MKKNLLLFLVLILLQSCSNDESSSSSVNTIPFQVAPIPGSLRLNINNLVLHVGETKTITARAYDGEGNQLPPSSINWLTSDSNVAVVSNGNITATGIGFCEINVNDGIHSGVICAINIVSSDTIITTSPTQVDFQKDLLVMQPNTTKSLPNYVIYNDQGTVTNPTVTFLPPANSGITISSNTITSSIIKGNFDVLLRVGNDTLQNTLRIHVMDQNETTRSIRIVPYTIPGYFYDDNIASPRPVLIKVRESYYEEGVLKERQFVTSPDKIELNDDCVTLNAQGYLTSIHQSETGYCCVDDGAGARIFGAGCLAKVYYKDRFVYSPMTVAINISDTWGAIMSNGDTYNYCITQGGLKLKYIRDGYMFIPNPYKHPISGTYYIKKNGEQFFYGTANTFTGTYEVQSLANIQSFFPIQIHHEGQPINYYQGFGLSNRGNSLHQYDSGTIIPELNLPRGSGNCIPNTTNPNPNNPTLQEVLSGHTWITNTCMRQEGLGDYITLNSDGTWYSPRSLFYYWTWRQGEHPTTWSVTDNRYILLNSIEHEYWEDLNSPLVQETEGFDVSNYNATAVTLDGVNSDWGESCAHILNRQ